MNEFMVGVSCVVLDVSYGKDGGRTDVEYGKFEDKEQQSPFFACPKWMICQLAVYPKLPICPQPCASPRNKSFVFPPFSTIALVFTMLALIDAPFAYDRSGVRCAGRLVANVLFRIVCAGFFHCLVGLAMSHLRLHLVILQPSNGNEQGLEELYHS